MVFEMVYKFLGVSIGLDNGVVECFVSGFVLDDSGFMLVGDVNSFDLVVGVILCFECFDSVVDISCD